MVLSGKAMPCCEVLVVRDLNGAESSVHGILGMNVICRCNRELFGLFEFPDFGQPVALLGFLCLVKVFFETHYGLQ